MSTSQSQSINKENTKLDNSTYNILIALGKDADFLYSTVDTYIRDAQNEGRNELANVWNEIKSDKQKHLNLLKDCLEKEVQNSLSNK